MYMGIKRLINRYIILIYNIVEGKVDIPTVSARILVASHWSLNALVFGETTLV